jgi:truncated hemoglobin YjbI
MPKKQTTAGRKARAAAREGEKYTTALRRQLPPGTGPSAVSAVSETGSAHPVRLEHRRLLDHPPGFRPFRGTDLFERIGGQPTIDRLVDLLYDGIRDDDQLRPLFPRDLAGGRSMQKLFFAEWLGGPCRFSERAYAGLRHTHDGLQVTAELASRWLEHFRRAMEATVTAGSDRTAIFAQVRSLAMALVSGQVAPARPSGRGSRPGRKDVRGSESGNGPRPVAWCGIGARSVARARDLARRGDVAGLGAALADAPDLLLPSYAAAIMQAAALAGRAEIVRMLLDSGVGADHPFYLPVGVTGLAFERVVFVTPLCAARMKRRSVVRALLRHGASANDRRAGDPEGATGVRALSATALHYAAKAGFLRTIEVLVEHGADPEARDSHGRTPLDWLDQAAPSVPRAAVRNLIAPGQ